MRNLGFLIVAVLAGCSARVSDAQCETGEIVDPQTETCVECVPGEPGQCVAGEHCSTDGTCETGCAVDVDCGAGGTCCSGQCVDTTSDAASCGACGNSCGAGEGCCDSQCTGMSSLTDCGACGNTCDAGEFCDGTQCNEATYPNFCANKTVYVVHDGVVADESSADLMASTITQICPADVVVRIASQTDPALVDQATGRPLAGSGVTYVLGGGPFPNKPLKWLETTQKVTPVYFDAPDGVNFVWRRRTDHAAVASMPASACSAKHDQFLTELVTDPVSGTLSLVGYGACSGGKGTLAAAWHYANVLLPNRASYPDGWYVFGWTDANSNGAPDAADTFKVLASGT